MKARLVKLLLAALFMVIWTTGAKAQYRRPYSGSRVAGSFLAGQGALAQGLGQFNLANSQAAINNQQAYSAYLDNRLKSVQVYFERRQLNASYRAEMRRPPATPEEIVAFNDLRTPARLAAEQLDARDGSLRWPAVLRGSEFDDLRIQLDGLFAERALHPYDAGLGTPNYRQIRRVADAIRGRLKSQLDQITPDEYLAGNKFLNSVGYEGRFDSAANPAG
jgi:hypothetical protein